MTEYERITIVAADELRVQLATERERREAAETARDAAIKEVGSIGRELGYEQNRREAAEKCLRWYGVEGNYERPGTPVGVKLFSLTEWDAGQRARDHFAKYESATAQDIGEPINSGYRAGR